MKGNEWMDEAFRDTKRAELTDIASSFSDLDNMRLFWVAEHASPPGRCGGGLRYLVASAMLMTCTISYADIIVTTYVGRTDEGEPLPRSQRTHDSTDVHGDIEVEIHT